MKYPGFPFSPNFSTVGGMQMHYLDEGDRDAEVAIMLHGNPSWCYYYRALVTALNNRYRCIVPDHIGMGLSEKPTEHQYDFTLERRVSDLISLLDNLDIKKDITLIVHDWGGMIGMAYAIRYPERIKRLVVLNTAAFPLPNGTTIPLSLRLSRIPYLNRLLNQGLNAFCRGAVKHCVSRAPMPDQVANAYLSPYNSWDTRLAVRRFVEDIPLRPEDKAYGIVNEVGMKLKNLTELPMLICWGMKDFVFNQVFLDEWISRFPHAEVHRFHDAGHYVLEDVSDEIIPLIVKFLSLNSIA